MERARVRTKAKILFSGEEHCHEDFGRYTDGKAVTSGWPPYSAVPSRFRYARISE